MWILEIPSTYSCSIFCCSVGLFGVHLHTNIYKRDISGVYQNVCLPPYLEKWSNSTSVLQLHWNHPSMLNGWVWYFSLTARNQLKRWGFRLGNLLPRWPDVLRLGKDEIKQVSKMFIILIQLVLTPGPTFSFLFVTQCRFLKKFSPQFLLRAKFLDPWQHLVL